MKCYLVRHGKDDDTVRGGWSDAPLTDIGIRQAHALADTFIEIKDNINTIYTSDLPRASQTADVLSAILNIPVINMPQFRETNNGKLAGMDNKLAEQLYPGLYWSTLDWNQPYPEGESPRMFFERISSAWYEFKQSLKNTGKDVILVTHGGVINVILCIENDLIYSNSKNPFRVNYAETVCIEL